MALQLQKLDLVRPKGVIFLGGKRELANFALKLADTLNQRLDFCRCIRR